MKCCICNKNINGSYYTDVWGHIACAEHIDSGEIINCSSCHGFSDRKYTLIDNRVLCRTCKNSVVDNVDDIESLKESVLFNLQKCGFGDLAMDTVSIEIASSSKIANIRGCEINIMNKGVALSQIKRSFTLFGGNSKSMQHAIYILESLPKVEFAGVLAHELIHAWQTQNGIHPPPLWCEGLCNLGSYYTYLMMPSPLTKILKQGLMDSPDPIYGDGFRAVHKLESEMGLSGVIAKYRHEYK